MSLFLLICQLSGARCFGADIDPRVLRGQMYAGSADQTADTTKRDIFENFKSYSLEKPELIRMDNHLLDRHFQFKLSGNNSTSNSNTSSQNSSKSEQHIYAEMFDAIVTDPPYGIRAGAKKSGNSLTILFHHYYYSRKFPLMSLDPSLSIYLSVCLSATLSLSLSLSLSIYLSFSFSLSLSLSIYLSIYLSI